MNKRLLGGEYEEKAAAYLIQHGYRILARNFFTRAGEIDLIARQGQYLVFIEVKYRNNTDCGDPSEAVTLQKQRRIVQSARIFMNLHHYGEDTPCRFDVVVLLGETIRIIQNAYDAY